MTSGILNNLNQVILGLLAVAIIVGAVLRHKNTEALRENNRIRERQLEIALENIKINEAYRKAINE